VNTILLTATTALLDSNETDGFIAVNVI